MKRTLFCFLVFCVLAVATRGEEPKPLRIFIRAGKKTHGPGQHDHPQFLKDWTVLLNQRGAKADGAMDFPTAEQLEQTDVLVMFAAEGGTISPEQRVYFEKFLKRGGGIVVIHDAVCGTDPQWFKTIVGGAWEHGHSKWFEGDISMYYQDVEHPITKEVSNFDFDDEMYYDLHMMPGAKILAASYAPDRRNTKAGRELPSVYDIVPQMWVYENQLQGGEKYRAFVSIPGHNYKSFNLPHYRAILLRGIAWAGNRDVDSLITKEEIHSLRYPEGGPTDPSKSAAGIKLQSDFNLNLVAAEPLINKPISIDWDARGRLWVAETPEYPQGRHITRMGTTATWTEKHNEQGEGDIENRPAHDRISILEDTNGDGVMDKKTVFYEGLELVTSLVFYKDGVIVSQAPDIYWLRDTNHDGKADEKITLYTGFGTFDTHAVVSNLRWGMDGWIYATVGYSRGDIFSGDRKQHFGQIVEGVIRFKPDGSALEQYGAKPGNTWGVDVAPDGELFFSQANGNHASHVVMPEGALARGRVDHATSFKVIEDHNHSYPIRDYKQAYAQIDWVGNFTAAAGACIYNGGAWPEKYDYTFYVTEPTINIVHQDFLKADGVSYVASKDPAHAEQEFIAGTDLWFRPIHTRVGPDGALYVVDFYNQAVVHNDTRGPKHGPNNAAIRPDRDHYFGRIWRVQHKEAKKIGPVDLENASPDELVRVLNHPNGWVRMTAQRLLIEKKPAGQYENVEQLALDQGAPTYSRVQALWLLQFLPLPADSKPIRPGLAVLKVLDGDKNPVVRKAAAQIALEAGGALPGNPVIGQDGDPDARVRLLTLSALAAHLDQTGMNPDASPEIKSESARWFLHLYEAASDPWTQSAALAVAKNFPTEIVEQTLATTNPAAAKNLVMALCRDYIAKQSSLSSNLVVVIAVKSSGSGELKTAALETLSKSVSSDQTPAWSPELQKAFQTLLDSKDSSIAAAALPLISAWDKTHAMTGALKTLVQEFFAKLNDAKLSDDERAGIISSLINVRQLSPDVIPTVASVIGSTNSVALQRRAIEALGSTGEPGVGQLLVASYNRAPKELRPSIFDALLKRGDWSLALVEAIKQKSIELTALDPNSVHRLRSHPDNAVAKAANEVIDEIRGPEMKEKNALIAKFTPLVTQPGNVQNGHQQFLKNCAVCHSFNNEGKDIAPNLTGMGAHGPEELIVHVLDPNRVCEPNFYAYSIETKDGEAYDGVIGRESKQSVLLRNASGDMEIERKNIKSMKNTGRSLMPEGFEALGAETLRDILGYLCSTESKYRILNLQPAFTADTTKGIYNSIDSTGETLAFKRFGVVRVGDLPFEIVNPQKTSNGRNVIVLRGGSGYAKTLPQHVEIPNINVKATKLHFLGAVGGWGWPWGGEKNRNLPTVKITVHYADNQSEEFVLKNAVDIVDYNSNQDVPGSKPADGLLQHGQVRWLSESLTHNAVIDRISLDSFNNHVAPTFVAVTAELGN